MVLRRPPRRGRAGGRRRVGPFYCWRLPCCCRRVAVCAIRRPSPMAASRRAGPAAVAVTTAALQAVALRAERAEQVPLMRTELWTARIPVTHLRPIAARGRTPDPAHPRNFAAPAAATAPRSAVPWAPGNRERSARALPAWRGSAAVFARPAKNAAVLSVTIRPRPATRATGKTARPALVPPVWTVRAWARVSRCGSDAWARTHSRPRPAARPASGERK